MTDAAPGSPREINAVLYATDFTVGDEPAFHHALKIATAARARLDILHADARDIEDVSWTEFPEVRHTLERLGLIEAGARRSAVAATLGIRIKKMPSHGGDPAQAIARRAIAFRADLIVLATHGRIGLPRWLKGSVAESAARRTWAMTLFVPHDARGFISAETGAARLERILVPADVTPRPGSRRSRRWRRSPGCWARPMPSAASSMSARPAARRACARRPGSSGPRCSRPARAASSTASSARRPTSAPT